jgi:hypothetical protein
VCYLFLRVAIHIMMFQTFNWWVWMLQRVDFHVASNKIEIFPQNIFWCCIHRLFLYVATCALWDTVIALFSCYGRWFQLFCGVLFYTCCDGLGNHFLVLASIVDSLASIVEIVSFLYCNVIFYPPSRAPARNECGSALTYRQCHSQVLRNRRWTCFG